MLICQDSLRLRKTALVVSLLGAGFVLSGMAVAGDQPVEIAQFDRVTADGAQTVRQYRNSDGGIFEISPDEGAMPLMVTEPRWTVSDGGDAWICYGMDIGDNGAIVMAGKALNNEAVTLYPATTSQAIWDFDALDSMDPIVAVADRANRSAAMVIYDMDPGPDYDFEATVNVFSNTGVGVPDWSYTFPLTLNYYGGGVAVSDDGDVVLMWKANPYTEYLLVEAFTGDGTPISSGQFRTTNSGYNYFHARQARLSDDGSRAYFNVGVHAVIYDVASATVDYEHYIGGSFDSHAMSGDGSHFAYGYFGWFKVYEETAPGTWSQVAYMSTGGSTYAAQLDLNQDGSRLGYTVQRYSPEYDHIEVGMYDVDNDVSMFNVPYDAPGTAYQLHPSGVRVDDNADYVAATSWGDSFNTTPEGFVYDSDGFVMCEIDSRGSAFSIGFDADGDVFGMGTKAVHANEMGNGGDVIVADAYEQMLHVVGYPQIGQSFDFEVAPYGDQVYITACDALGTSSTPYGEAEVDLNTELQRLGPYTIPVEGLVLPVLIPNVPFLVGNDVHFQALILGGDEPFLTNKVSIRIQP